MPAASEINNPLTPRQLDFIAKCAEGMTHAEIAAHFHVSHSNVTNVLDYARERAGAKNIVHLVALCVASGLIVYEDEQT